MKFNSFVFCQHRKRDGKIKKKKNTKHQNKYIDKQQKESSSNNGNDY